MMFSRLFSVSAVAALCAASGVMAGASNTAGSRHSGLIIATPLRIVPALLSMALVQQTMAVPIPQEEGGSAPVAVTTTEEITTTPPTTTESPITTTSTTSTTVAGALAVSTKSSGGAVAQGACGWGMWCPKGW